MKESPVSWFAQIVAGFAILIAGFSALVGMTLLAAVTPDEEAFGIAGWKVFVAAITYLLLSLILHQLARIADAVERQKP